AETTSHSSGPCHRQVVPANVVDCAHRVGNETPNTSATRAASGVDGRSRMPTMETNGSSRTRTARGTGTSASRIAACRCSSGLCRSCAGPGVIRSAITAVPFWVVQHGLTHDGLHELLPHWREHGLADPVPTALHQRQRERAAERGAVVTGCDVTDHRHRCPCGGNGRTLLDEL